VKVIGLSRFPGFKELYYVLGNRIKEYEKEILERVYSKEKRYGILVIHFKLLE